MFIFIDESGIHKSTDHSTFVLVYIQIDDYDKLEREVKAIEVKLKIENFHWAHTVWEVKEMFLEKVLKLDFKAKIAVIKNPVNPAKEIERVMSHMIIERNIKAIYIDGRKPKWYERRIKKILRDKGISVRKLQTVKDTQYAGIRLADMVAGLSRSYFDNKNLERVEKFYKQLKNKVIVIVE